MYVFLLGLAFFFFMISPPSDFPSHSAVTLTKGESLSQLASVLKEKHIVRSSFLLRNFVVWKNWDRKVVAGDYYFDKPISVFEVAGRISAGELGLVPLQITFPEGLNLFEFAEIARLHLFKFDPLDFLEKTHEKEGYLFPDTYKFLSNANADDVIASMEANFEAKIKTLQKDFDQSSHSLREVILMASILEEEAKTTEARKIVAGILWKRLRSGMALQVDSPFRYSNVENHATVKAEDITVDSPYNTYKYVGFPPTPISNPGIDSILAALYPTETAYWYFLSGKEGEMRYAKTFEEHRKNIEKYLK